MFKILFDQGLCGNFIADMKGNILLCNQAFSTMSGNSASTLNLKKAIGKQWDDLCHKLKTAEKVDIPKLTVARPDNAPWIVIARLIRALDNPYTYKKNIYGFFVDVTEQHLAESELAVLFKENQSLVRHSMQVREEERRNIAREIHDEMGQYLTTMRLELASLPWDKQYPLAEFVARINSNVEHIQQAVRRLIHCLGPTALDAHELVEAIEQLVSKWKEQHPAIECQLALDKSCLSLPEKTSIVAYRIVQESLTNIARHAHASHISIALSRAHGILSDTLTIEIHDDGVGFNPHLPRTGFGLTGMRERIEAEGGVFNVRSREKGLLISASLPFSTASKVIHES